jgi:hypothetical protein
MKRLLSAPILALLALLATAATPAQAAPGFDRAAWKADFERIKLGLAQGYANLDWQVERRGLNLRRADTQINAMLDQAGSDAEAMLVMTRLVEAFRDPHLKLEMGPAPASARPLPTTSQVADAPALCTDIDEPRAATRLPYAKAANWQPIGGAPFTSGMIDTTGYLRIPSFDEERYAPACRQVKESDAYKRRLAYRAALNRMLLDRIAALRSQGMTRLVIDLSGNGGGSEWSSELAGLLAGGTLVRIAPRLVASTCNRSAIWRGEKVCSPYVPVRTETLTGKGGWSGKLAIITNRDTASAAEEFVTWLRDNGQARTVGERTLGAGCGYVDGGSAIALKAAPVHLMVPNCSRYTKAGLNEIEGLAPDVAIDWGSATPEQAVIAIEQAF